MDLTSANLQALFRAYNTSFQRGFASMGADGALYEQFCTTVPSTTAVEVYPFLKSLPPMARTRELALVERFFTTEDPVPAPVPGRTAVST